MYGKNKYTIIHGEEADTFDDCAAFWDQVISEEEEGTRCPKSYMTLKTAVNLQYCWKKNAKENATYLPVHDANNNVRRDL